MSDKTFKQRVFEEAASFAEIYEYFREDLEAWQHEHSSVGSDWQHLFAVPLNGTEAHEPADRKAARIEWKVPHKHDAVRKTADQLGELMRVGPIVTNDDRISTALDMEFLFPNDIAPGSGNGLAGVGNLAHRLKPENDDPVFWRALMEVLCRAFTASKGQPPWSLQQMIELAFDMDDIRRGTPTKQLKVSDYHQALQDQDYIAIYSRNASATEHARVGKDRIKQVMKLIGPMDKRALSRLKAIFPEEFEKGAERHLRRKMLKGSSDHIAALLDMAEDVNDALEADRQKRLKAPDGERQ